MFSKTHLDKTYGFEAEVWEAAKVEAGRALRARAEAEDLISYGELSREISAIKFDPHESNFHHFLGQLSVESDAAGGGMISALVVHKDGDQLPGSGFFSLARELGRNVTDRVRCWADEVKRVYSAGQRK
jgi:hypothetical protein